MFALSPCLLSLGCNSSLSASIPDENWRASCEEGQMTFAAHNARMNSAADSGWCISTRKGNKRAFIQVSAVHHMLGRLKMHSTCFLHKQEMAEGDGSTFNF